MFQIPDINTHDKYKTMCTAVYLAWQCHKNTVDGYSHVHTRVVGSGFHLPSASHTALVLPTETNPGLHLKNISAPSVVF